MGYTETINVSGSADDGGMVCGYPKTGRTWLRYMLGSYMNRHYDLGVNLNLRNLYSVVPNEQSEKIAGQPDFAFEGRVPKIEMSHSQYQEEVHCGQPTVFLTRDPRDILVSHWHHRRNQVGIYDGSLSDFVRDRNQGINAFVEHLETWAPYLSEGQVVTYEYMREDAALALQKVLAALRLSSSTEEVAAAVAESSFDKMRQKEVQDGIAGHSYDRSNPEALRVRRGKVGGFEDYMSLEDQEYIYARIARASLPAAHIIGLTGYFSR